MSEWKCSYKSCECISDAEKSECDLAYKINKMKDKDVHYEFWLLMIPYYCDRWMQGVSYDDLMAEYSKSQPSSLHNTQ